MWSSKTDCGSHVGFPSKPQSGTNSQNQTHPEGILMAYSWHPSCKDVSNPASGAGANAAVTADRVQLLPHKPNARNPWPWSRLLGPAVDGCEIRSHHFESIGHRCWYLQGNLQKPGFLNGAISGFRVAIHTCPGIFRIRIQDDHPC